MHVGEGTQSLQNVLSLLTCIEPAWRIMPQIFSLEEARVQQWDVYVDDVAILTARQLLDLSLFLFHKKIKWNDYISKIP